MKAIHIRKQTVLTFTETIAALLHSGLSIQDSLGICAEISANKQCLQLCRQLQSVLLTGQPFYKALSEYEYAFSPLYVSLVQLGEKTGSVASVFERLDTYLHRKKETQGKIIQALIYPITVTITAFAVSIFVVLFVFPQIQDIFTVFTAGNIEATENIQGMYNSMIGLGIFFIVFIVFIILCIVLYKKNETMALVFDRFFLCFPITGKIIKSVCTNDFSFAMELLLGAGIPLVQSLRQASHLITNREYKMAVERVADSVFCGERLAVAFKAEKVFPSYIIQWIGIGEKTGQPASVFTQIHTYFEKENNHLISMTLSAAEPAFILIAGFVLIFLVIQFVLPIFSLLGGI